MVFNIKAENKDDHAKNFSFMLNKENQWQLTPAYDLTRSAGINEEHTTSIQGKVKTSQMMISISLLLNLI